MDTAEHEVLVKRVKQAVEIIEAALPYTERDQLLYMREVGFAVVLKHLLEPHPLQDAIKRAREQE